MSKYFIPRRTFLKGAGASILLPVLDIMTPPKAMGAVPASTPRFAMYFMSLGMYSAGYDPTKTGTSRYFQAHTLSPEGGLTWRPRNAGPLPNELPVHLTPFNSMRNKVTVISGLSALPGDSNDPSTNHSAGTTAWAVAAWQGMAQALGNNVSPPDSLDQFIANACGINPGSTLVFNPGTGDIVEGGGGHCGFISSNSKLGGNNLVPRIQDPLKVFNQLFGSCKASVSNQGAVNDQKSILDHVSGQIQNLQKTVGKDDRNRLEAYFQNIREVEKSIQAIPGNNCPTTPAYDPKLDGGDLDWLARMRMMMDVTALAMASDAMPIASIMTDVEANGSSGYQRRVSAESDYRDSSGRKVEYHGPIDTHFDITHNSDPNFGAYDPKIVLQAIEEWFAYTRMNMNLLKRLASKLDSMPVEPNGNTPLDNSLILAGCAHAHSQSHCPHNLPTILLGGKKFGLKQGHHIAFPQRTHLGRLYLTMIRAMGINAANYHIHKEILPGVFNV